MAGSRLRIMPRRPETGSLTQVVAQQLTEAHERSEVGHRLATTGAPGVAMDPADPAQVAAVLEYIVAELVALERIVEELAGAFDGVKAKQSPGRT